MYAIRIYARGTRRAYIPGAGSVGSGSRTKGESGAKEYPIIDMQIIVLSPPLGPGTFVYLRDRTQTSFYTRQGITGELARRRRRSFYTHNIYCVSPPSSLPPFVLSLNNYIHIIILLRVCVCVCVSTRTISTTLLPQTDCNTRLQTLAYTEILLLLLDSRAMTV